MMMMMMKTMMMRMSMMMMTMMMMIPRFIQHLANGTTLSIVTFGMEARLILPPTVVTDTNRETLYGRVGINMLMSILMSVMVMVTVTAMKMTAMMMIMMIDA